VELLVGETFVVSGNSIAGFDATATVTGLIAPLEQRIELLRKLSDWSLLSHVVENISLAREAPASCLPVILITFKRAWAAIRLGKLCTGRFATAV